MYSTFQSGTLSELKNTLNNLNISTKQIIFGGDLYFYFDSR